MKHKRDVFYKTTELVMVKGVSLKNYHLHDTICSRHILNAENKVKIIEFNHRKFSILKLKKEYLKCNQNNEN